ncbi:hypothetical protein ACFXP3_10380 [Streptomyces sp. NPDC059096]
MSSRRDRSAARIDSFPAISISMLGSRSILCGECKEDFKVREPAE